MSKMSKAIAVLGVVAGLGVAALPLSSYAADEPYSQSTSADVQVGVSGAISIEVDNGATDAGAAKNLDHQERHYRHFFEDCRWC